ncbi:hypothetical protein GCM10009634_75150 [Saccharothrix xinjiangensis]
MVSFRSGDVYEGGAQWQFMLAVLGVAVGVADSLEGVVQDVGGLLGGGTQPISELFWNHFLPQSG